MFLREGLNKTENTKRFPGVSTQFNRTTSCDRMSDQLHELLQDVLNVCEQRDGTRHLAVRRE